MMSRIRTVKPEYWTSEQIMELSLPARLLFVGLWNFCDDAGIHPANLKTLKAQVLPNDDVDVGPLMAEIINQGLVCEYEVAGKPYWRVTGWCRHQRIDRPTFKYPWPNGEIPSSNSELKEYFDEYSTSSRRCLDPGKEWNGKERKGKEGSGEENPVESDFMKIFRTAEQG